MKRWELNPGHSPVDHHHRLAADSQVQQLTGYRGHGVSQTAGTLTAIQNLSHIYGTR